MTKELFNMIDQDIRKSFGKRLKTLRKQKGWTQKELAGMLDIGLSQFNKYEYGLHMPPVEKLIELSRLLDTSLDFLMNSYDTDDYALHNKRLIKRFKELERFDFDEQEAIIKFLDAMIIKNKMQGAMVPLDL